MSEYIVEWRYCPRCVASGTIPKCTMYEDINSSILFKTLLLYTFPSRNLRKKIVKPKLISPLSSRAWRGRSAHCTATHLQTAKTSYKVDSHLHIEHWTFDLCLSANSHHRYDRDSEKIFHWKLKFRTDLYSEERCLALSLFRARKIWQETRRRGRHPL